MSLALASSIADRIQRKNLPPELKKALIETTSERVAAVVKDDFVRIASSNAKGVTFHDKEASFMREVYGL